MKKILLLLLLVTTTIFAKYYIISNRVYTNIYSTMNKIPEIGIVHLTWVIVKQKEKRINKYHSNHIINSSYQATNTNYRHSGYDKGHFSASKSDWDNNKTDMVYTFAFTNMTPQYPKTNRISYRRTEVYGQKLTKKYKSVYVINIAVPSDKYIKGHVNIPSVYYKIFMFNNTKECYMIPNNNKIYTLHQMRIPCNKIMITKL